MLKLLQKQMSSILAPNSSALEPDVKPRAAVCFAKVWVKSKCSSPGSHVKCGRTVQGRYISVTETLQYLNTMVLKEQPERRTQPYQQQRVATASCTPSSGNAMQ